MKIEDIIKEKDYETYEKLNKMRGREKPIKIKLDNKKIDEHVQPI